MHDELMNDDWQNLVKINEHYFSHSVLKNSLKNSQ